MERDLSYRGAFYPKESREIESFIKTHTHGNKIEEKLRGIVVPHAGWIYSGQTALKGYSHIPNGNIKHIVLLGPSHRVPVRGVAKTTYTSYKTVTSTIPIYQELQKELENRLNLIEEDKAHIYEHSLEVQLEFINYFYKDIDLLPLVVGANLNCEIETILNISLNREDTFTIISSDLSHYLPYDIAQKKDSETIESIINCKTVRGDDACGSVILNGLTSYIKDSTYSIRLIDYTNSGDTAGDRDAVVGYAALGIYKNG